MSQELVASMQHAESLLKGRDPEGALRVLGKALAARPVLPRAHMIAAMSRLRQGRAGEAVWVSRVFQWHVNCWSGRLVPQGERLNRIIGDLQYPIFAEQPSARTADANPPTC